MRYTLLLLLLICINARAQNQHIAYPNIAVKTPKAAAKRTRRGSKKKAAEAPAAEAPVAEEAQAE